MTRRKFRGFKTGLKLLLARFLLWISGWELEGEIPKINKCVIIGAPHTSNWDFYFGMLYKMHFGLPIHFLMKRELFHFPIGIFMKWIGGIPVDRQQHNDLVIWLGDKIKGSALFYLAISPEGTRKKVNVWKRGFYHIAIRADVPIVMAYMDYRRRVVGVGPVFTPGNDIEADMNYIAEFYSHVVPKFPDRFELPALVTGND